jgi:hypothetical protein
MTLQFYVDNHGQPIDTLNAYDLLVLNNIPISGSRVVQYSKFLSLPLFTTLRLKTMLRNMNQLTRCGGILLLGCMLLWASSGVIPNVNAAPLPSNSERYVDGFISIGSFQGALSL